MGDDININKVIIQVKIIITQWYIHLNSLNFPLKVTLGCYLLLAKEKIQLIFKRSCNAVDLIFNWC